MAPKKDPRRIKLVVPYEEPTGSKSESDTSSSMASLMPMAAMLTRNRFIGWGAVIYSVLGYLGESEDARKNASMPGIFSVGMSLMALAVTYLPVFLPPQGQQGTPSASAATPIPVA